MQLVVAVAFVAFALTSRGHHAEGQKVTNFTCPQHCTCDAVTLTCHSLVELPSLDDVPFQFTTFFFHDCLLENLSKLPVAYGNATDLLVINSHLSTIDENAFEELGKLEVLELSGNRLSSISMVVLGPLKNLVKLDLGENRFEELPDELFRGLTKLNELRLDGNSFEFRENLFEGAGNLKKFTCNNCRLRSVPAESLKRIKSLEHLELNQNQLRFLPGDAFGGMQVESHPLLHLSLDNCSLEAVDRAALKPFTALRQLNLGHNKLKSISVGTFKHFWNSLDSVYLENNQLTSVDENLAPWSKMKEVKLGHNLWLCDCKMAWIKNIELEKIDKENVTCVTPSNLQGHQLHDEMVKLNCPNRKHYLIIGFGIPLLSLVLVVSICCVVKLATRSHSRRGEVVKYVQVKDP